MTIENIMKRLMIAIESIKTKGDNNNGKIDTKGERGQIAKLLAGAEQEIGDFFEVQSHYIGYEKMSYYDHLSAEHKLNDCRHSAFSQIANLRATLLDPNEQYDLDKVGMTHKYADGSYNVKKDSFEDGSYTAEHKDKDGKIVGLKAYKNNKEVYTNPDFVAKKLGLNVAPQRRSLGQKIGDGALSLVTLGIIGSTPNENIKDNQYYKFTKDRREVKAFQDAVAYTYTPDATYTCIYEWDAKGNQFIQVQ